MRPTGLYHPKPFPCVMSGVVWALPSPLASPPSTVSIHHSVIQPDQSPLCFLNIPDLLLLQGLFEGPLVWNSLFHIFTRLLSSHYSGLNSNVTSLSFPRNCIIVTPVALSPLINFSLFPLQMSSTFFTWLPLENYWFLSAFLFPSPTILSPGHY